MGDAIPLSPDWYPDWRGETCVIVASGPSAKDADLESARGKARFVVINESWRLAPWADVLYACDDRWWVATKGCPEFRGLKVTQDKSAAAKFGIHHVTLVPGKYQIITEPGKLGWGGNGGFHAVNLVVQFGVKKIVLVGFDMHLRNGGHWHGPHGRGLTNPNAHNMERWRQMLDDTKPHLAELGIKVFNTSPASALQRFPKVTLAEALA